MEVGADEEEEQVDPRSLKPDLYAAAQQNDTIKVLELLAIQVPATYVDDSNGWTPLHWAAKNGNVTMLNKMIECGASAPYHRMVLKAKEEAAWDGKKEKGNPSPAEVGIGGSQENASPNQGEAEVLDAALTAAAAAPPAAAVEGDAGAGAEAAAPSSPSHQAPPAVTTTLNFEEDEDDEDDEFAIEKRLETSVDLTKNTPLLWACVKGHLNCVWALLVNGYSPNDIDDMGNNALHLAAAAGNRKVVKVLIDDGVKATLVNIYKNLPIDMATDKEVREMIADAAVKGASMTKAEMDLKHEANMRTYRKMVNALNTAVSEAKSVLDRSGGDSSSSSSSGLSPRSMPAVPATPATSAQIGDTIRMLADALRVGKDWAMDHEVIATGAGYMTILEASQELMNDLVMADREFPYRSQGHYTLHVRKVEIAAERAEGVGVSAKLVTSARDIIQRAQIEVWLSTMLTRLASVECAMEHHEHDLNKLKAALVKGQVQHASGDIVDEAVKLHRRLECELGMSRALQSFPTYKLPWSPKEPTDPPPEGYYTEADFGRVKETEEYPHPPADTGEYIWEPSLTYSSLQSCIAKLKESFVGAEALGADPKTVADAKAKLVKAEKDFKLLHVKEENDKLQGIEETKKKMKKKPGAGGKK